MDDDDDDAYDCAMLDEDQLVGSNECRDEEPTLLAGDDEDESLARAEADAFMAGMTFANKGHQHSDTCQHGPLVDSDGEDDPQIYRGLPNLEEPSDDIDSICDGYEDYSDDDDDDDDFSPTSDKRKGGKGKKGGGSKKKKSRNGKKKKNGKGNKGSKDSQTVKTCAKDTHRPDHAKPRPLSKFGLSSPPTKRNAPQPQNVIDDIVRRTKGYYRMDN